MRSAFYCVSAILVFPVTVLADEAASVSVGAGLWAFANSPLGMMMIASLVAYLGGRLFTAKPTWKKYVDKYRPTIIAAIKKAEKEIADDTQNKSLARLDTALKYVIEVEGKLNEDALKQAVTAVHAEAEASKNI